MALSGPGAIRGDRVFGKVSELLDGSHIEELPIPSTAVAVDVVQSSYEIMQDALTRHR